MQHCICYFCFLFFLRKLVLVFAWTPLNRVSGTGGGWGGGNALLGPTPSYNCQYYIIGQRTKIIPITIMPPPNILDLPSSLLDSREPDGI